MPVGSEVAPAAEAPEAELELDLAASSALWRVSSAMSSTTAPFLRDLRVALHRGWLLHPKYLAEAVGGRRIEWSRNSSDQRPHEVPPLKGKLPKQETRRKMYIVIRSERLV